MRTSEVTLSNEKVLRDHIRKLEAKIESLDTWNRVNSRDTPSFTREDIEFLIPYAVIYDEKHGFLEEENNKFNEILRRYNGQV